MPSIYCERTSKIVDSLRGVSTSDGSFGTYYQISKLRGIKVLSTRYQSISRARQGSAYRSAVRELKILNTLTERGCKITPKGYSIKIIQYKDFYGRPAYHVGIVMRHLGNKRLSSYDYPEKKEESISSKLESQLRNYGVKHQDLHARNIMKFKGKFYAIDFTPMYTKVLKQY